jgi:peroxiredoxin
LIAAMAIGGIVVATRIVEPSRSTSTPPPPVAVVVTTEEKHRVTPEMEQASEAAAGRTVPDVTLPSSDGATRSLRDLAAGGAPIVLVFIKDGCPCSESAQPYYNRLFAAYGSKATFLGVIDRDPEGARAWGSKFRASFPIVADPDLSLMRALRATNSAYFVLIHHNAVSRMWPGYSVGMLEEAGADLARATGRTLQPIDTSDAPENPYSGCPYDLDDPPSDPRSSPSPSPPAL